MPLTMGTDVLANLERLQEARDLSAMAKVLQESGQTWEARQVWSTVRRLAPGSRFDFDAQEMLTATAPRPEGSSGTTESAEPPEASDSIQMDIDDFLDRLSGTLRRVIPTWFPIWFEIRIEVQPAHDEPAAEFPLTTETYPVGELIVPRYSKGPGVAAPDEKQLIEWIQGIAPESWQKQGGLGSIEYDSDNKTLVVRQVASMHERIGAFLRLLPPDHDTTDPAKADDLQRLTLACLLAVRGGGGASTAYSIRQLFIADPARVLAHPALRRFRDPYVAAGSCLTWNESIVGDAAWWEDYLLGFTLPPPTLPSWPVEAFAAPSPIDSIPRLWRRVAIPSKNQNTEEDGIGIWNAHWSPPRPIGPLAGWAVWGPDPFDPPTSGDRVSLPRRLDKAVMDTDSWGPSSVPFLDLSHLEGVRAFGLEAAATAALEGPISEAETPGTAAPPIMPRADDDAPPETSKPTAPEQPYPLCHSGEEEESSADEPESAGSLILGIGANEHGLSLTCSVRTGERCFNIVFTHSYCLPCCVGWEIREEKDAPTAPPGVPTELAR
jgi:hypothetical protein